jgi:ribosome-associated toxin RatA of RatAB toxin-antitoxin module
LFFDAINKIHNVDSYLTFLTFLSGSFILGYSGTETMKLFRVTSNREVIEERYTEDVKIEENINETSYSESVHTIILKEPLTHNAKEEDYKL